MTAKRNRTDPTWTLLGGPQGGTISSLAIGHENDGDCIFIGSPAGLYRSSGPVNSAGRDWERLANSPLGVMSMGLSPDFAEDHTVITGTHTGIYLSQDKGTSWHAAQMPSSTSMVLSLAFSPNYLSDGVILAGTLEDGVFISTNRGERWLSQSFGLLDPTVYSLVVSPNVARDGLIFAATGTTVYFSYNAGRAWRPLAFPEEAAPVLSLAYLPGLEGSGILLAGTETQGLYLSSDQGETWQKNSLPVETINAFAALQDGSTVLAATAAGIFESRDQGLTWQELASLPDVLAVALDDGIALAGVVDQGVWMSAGLEKWEPISNLPLRSMLGQVLSPQFEKDGQAYLFGPDEGIWITGDGGRTWNDLSETLPSLEINSITLSPGFASNKTLFAASKDGLLLSEEAGQSWTYGSEEPCQILSFAPNGKTLIASFPGLGIRTSDDMGLTWQNLPGPWDSGGGEILTLAVTNLHYYYIAHLEGVGETVTLWQGKAGLFEKVISEPAGDNPHVSFWFPAGAASDRPWFTSLGDQVWRFSSRSGEVVSHSRLDIDNPSSESILSITGVIEPSGQIRLFAGTTQRIYQSTDSVSWDPIYEFGQDRVVAFTLSPDFLNSRTVYALLLGGSFCKFKL